MSLSLELHVAVHLASASQLHLFTEGLRYSSFGFPELVVFKLE